MSAPPPSGRTVASLAVQFFVNGFVYASYIPRLPEVRDRTGISIAVLGLALTASSGAGLVASFFTGRVIPKVGSKRVIVLGGILYAVALPGIGLATSALPLVLALVVLATFDVYVDVAMNYQASVVSARRPKPVMSRLHGTWSAGTLAGAGTAVLATRAEIAVPVHYAAVAVVVVIALLASAPGLLRTDERHPQQVAEPTDGRRTWRRVGWTAVLLGLANAMAVAVETSTSEWTSFRLRDDLGASASLAASAFVVFTAAMTLGRLSGDAVTQRIGGLATCRLGAATAGAGVLVTTLAPSPAATLAGVAITALGISVLSPQLADTAARAPGPPGAGFTALFVGHRTATLVVPAGIGGLAAATTSVGTGMAILALPCAAILVLVLPHVIRPQQSGG